MKGHFIQATNGEVVILNAEYEPVYVGELRTMADYIDECLHGNNECARLIEKVEIIDTHKDAIVWYDWETDEIFITY